MVFFLGGGAHDTKSGKNRGNHEWLKRFLALSLHLSYWQIVSRISKACRAHARQAIFVIVSRHKISRHRAFLVKFPSWNEERERRRNRNFRCNVSIFRNRFSNLFDISLLATLETRYFFFSFFFFRFERRIRMRRETRNHPPTREREKREKSSFSITRRRLPPWIGTRPVIYTGTGWIILVGKRSRISI